MHRTMKSRPAGRRVAPHPLPGPPPIRRGHPLADPNLMTARRAVQQFLTSEFEAREVRITKVSPASDGGDSWHVEAEVLVPNLDIKTLGLPLSQEVLEKEYCVIELAPDMTVKAFEVVDR